MPPLLDATLFSGHFFPTTAEDAIRDDATHKIALTDKPTCMPGNLNLVGILVTFITGLFVFRWSPLNQILYTLVTYVNLIMT